MKNRIFRRSAQPFPGNPFSSVALFDANSAPFQKFSFDLEQVLIELETSYQNQPQSLRCELPIRNGSIPIAKKPQNVTNDEFDFDIDARWI